VGDPAQPPTFVITSLDGDDVEHVLNDGGELALILPPQGGRVAFVGVRAMNVDACAITLSGTLRDEATGQERSDTRPADLFRAVDGWATTGSDAQSSDGSSVGSITSFSNITLCPNDWSTTDIYGHPYALTVTLTDSAKRTAKRTIHVTPACPEPARVAECTCLCKQGYVLGDRCEQDASVGDAPAD
jgi:hypothetical protein